MPGLVNAHTHTAMTLMRGVADDVPLDAWLREHIWPREGRFVTPEFVHDGVTLGAVEMLRGGITVCNDMYFYPDAAARAYEAAGMRAVIGMAVLDFPTPYASDADDYLRLGLAARDAFKGSPTAGAGCWRRTRRTPSATPRSPRSSPTRASSTCRSRPTCRRRRPSSTTPSPRRGRASSRGSTGSGPPGRGSSRSTPCTSPPATSRSSPARDAAWRIAPRRT